LITVTDQKAPGWKSVANFHRANADRTKLAATATVARARVALADPGCPAGYRPILQTRIDYPDASLADLADLLHVSKDTYAGYLRRALDRYPAEN